MPRSRASRRSGPADPALAGPAPAAARPPRQDRSRDSMDRVLTATEELLREQVFEDLTLKQILRRAKVSVGAFYGRFAGKDALVPCLHERYDRRQAEIVERVLAPARWRRHDLRRRVRLLVRYALLIYRRHRGLLRALVLDWRLQPEAITDEHRAVRRAFHGRLIDVLVGDGDEISHPDPRQAAAFALVVLGAVCRDVLVTASAEHPHPMDPVTLRAELEARLVHALWSNLSTAPLPPRG